MCWLLFGTRSAMIASGIPLWPSGVLTDHPPCEFRPPQVLGGGLHRAPLFWNRRAPTTRSALPVRPIACQKPGRRNDSACHRPRSRASSNLPYKSAFRCGRHVGVASREGTPHTLRARVLSPLPESSFVGDPARGSESHQPGQALATCRLWDSGIPTGGATRRRPYSF